MSQYKCIHVFSCFSWVFITTKGLTDPTMCVIVLYSQVMALLLSSEQWGDVCDTSTPHYETPIASPSYV